MNRLEKRSFYSFVALYIVSSYLFLILSAYWYYTARKNAIVNETFFRMEHIADHTGGEIIDAHMHRHPLRLSMKKEGFHIALLDDNGTVRYGEMPVPVGTEPFRGTVGKYAVLVSQASRDHMGIARIVVETRRIYDEIARLRQRVATVVVAAAAAIALIGWVLSKLFLRPVRRRIAHIESFIDSIAHELNTPVSALTMISQQALKKGGCGTKELRHIAVSSRQLYDIYRSLTFLSFGAPQNDKKPLALDRVLLDVIKHYEVQAEIKGIVFATDIAPLRYLMNETEAHLLFSNLVGNAVKYSPRHGEVRVTLARGLFTIEDDGIGIDTSKQATIFEKFERATEYGGGFGVGLSIVKQICDRYGIDIEVRSHKGKGTRFVLRFPVSEEDQAR